MSTTSPHENSSESGTARSDASVSSGLIPFVAGLFLVGLVARVVPFFNSAGRMLFQWPTEDGYLTLQIARNMALGLGMSVSEGTIATNGTQPFCTIVWSLLYRLVGADKEQGVLLVLVFELLIAVGTALLIHRVALRLWKTANRQSIALLASAVWFASPLVIGHTMNCLESGMYALAILTTVTVTLSFDTKPGQWNLSQILRLGGLLGWVFWVRNDGVFFILGMCVSHWLVGVRRYGLPLLGRSLLEAIQFGAISVLIAAPWLYSNMTGFGHLMPISGIAESYHATFAHNLYLIPVNFMEYVGVVLPIPEAFEHSPAVVAVTSILLAISLFIFVRVLRKERVVLRPEAIAVLIYAACLSSFYGFYFGAPHFVDRYLFPFSPWLAMIWAAVFFRIVSSVRAALAGRVMLAFQATVMLLVVAQQWRIYHLGPDHGHRQVVEWVQQNVEEDVWVAAIQTGTLGYYHDKTYNLDGKVSPEALEAKLAGEIPAYVVEKDIQFLIDWVGIASFQELPEISEHFELELKDKERNLAVLRRER